MTPSEVALFFGLDLSQKSALPDLKISANRNAFVCDGAGNIIGLNLGSEGLSSITVPAGLNAVQYLNVSDNKRLESLVFEVGLPELEELDASACGLKELVLPRGFDVLQTVSVQDNHLQKFEIVDACPELAFLDLAGNELTEISLPSRLPRLESLFLHGGNKIQDLLFLQNVTSLLTLNLAGNAVTDLRPLRRLVENGLEVKSKDRGQGILVADCPLTSPPPEIIEQGRDALLNYFKELEGEVDRIREVKMLVLGEGGAGKTSLVVRLKEGMDAELPGPTESTKGIDIYDYPFEIGQNDGFKINIWDFGGQEIYHATHQFFLTKRSLYVLVTDVRKEDTDFNFWLQLIDLLSDKSPVLIFQNQKGRRKKDINEAGLKGQFGNIKEFFAFDLKDDAEGLKRFQKEIEHQVQSLPHVNEVLPKAWVDIRKAINALKEEGRHFINDSDYFELSERFGLEEDRAEFLSRYLHDLGVFLHFQEDPILKRWVFLDNEWVTEGVYAILDNARVIERKGKFCRADAEEVWTGKYKRMHDELLQLMTKFELCYRIPDIESEEYIAPQLLPANEPNLGWDTGNNLQLRYHYKFMPKGLLSRLIVRLHRYIQDVESEAWKTGVVLHRQGAQAKVVETYGVRNIHIHGKGSNARELLTIIAEEIDRLNSGYHNLQAEILVPCNCAACRALEEPNFYEYEDLMRRKERGKMTVECSVSYENIDVLKLIDNVFADKTFKPQSVRAFISYSKKDIDHLESLKKQLAVLQRQGTLFTWDDTKLTPGEEWDGRIKSELNNANLIIILVSPDALATDYIWDVEMKAALDRHERGDAVVVPVIVRPCLWDTTPLAKYNVLPVKGKAVASWDKQDEAWEQVARKLKEFAEQMSL